MGGVVWWWGGGVVVLFLQAEDGIRGYDVTGVQTCALPIWPEAKGMISLGGSLCQVPSLGNIERMSTCLIFRR